jgi:hypothetical protein
MRIAQQDLLYYAIEDEWNAPDWPDGVWPEPGIEVTDAMWNASVNIDLQSIIPGSIEYTYLREIIIIIEHNAYHLGKIVDIRKAFGDWIR